MPTGFCVVCGNTTSRGRQCQRCNSELCHRHSYERLALVDVHGHRHTLPTPERCFVCAREPLEQSLAPFNELTWVECSQRLHQLPHPRPVTFWQDLAEHLQAICRPTPQTFSFDAGLFGDIFNFRSVDRRSGWVVLISGGGAFLDESDLTWRATGYGRGVSRAQWRRSAGATAAGPQALPAATEDPDAQGGFHIVTN